MINQYRPRWHDSGHSYGTDCAGGTDIACGSILYSSSATHVYRQADLSGAVSPDCRSIANNSDLLKAQIAERSVKLQVSADGGATWTTLQTYSSSEFTGAGTDTFDISAYASANTQIRFLITSSQMDAVYILFRRYSRSHMRTASAFVSAVNADQLKSERPGCDRCSDRQRHCLP